MTTLYTISSKRGKNIQRNQLNQLTTVDSDWYIGLVEDVCAEEGDVKLRFMHPKGPGRPENCFFWPSTVDICYIPQTDILCKVSAPIPSSKSARKYKISTLDAKSISNNIEFRVNNQ